MAWSNLKTVKTFVCGASLLAALASTGCQSDYAGQTLPSAYWHTDDIQYFPPGPEFKLSREAAALKAQGTGRGSRPVSGPLGPAEIPPGPGPGVPDGLGAGPVGGPPVGPPAGEVPAADEAPGGDMPAEGALPPEDAAAPGADPFNNP